MSYGYSARTVARNKKASIRSLGVRLGRECIRRDISVNEVAAEFGVSRQTVYNWFCGITVPQDFYTTHIKELLHTLATS
jgi:transcriptional regulator with XRE-family HTH domain